MEQGLSWEADSSSVNKDVPCMLWNLQVCYHVQRRTCHLYVFNQTNHVHIFLSCYFEDPFLGTFAKLRKATISFFFFLKLHHVCPSAWKNSVPTLDGFSWSLMFEYFRQICQRKFKFHWNLTKIMGMYMKNNINFWSYLALFFPEWQIFQKNKVVNKTKHTFYIQ